MERVAAVAVCFSALVACGADADGETTPGGAAGTTSAGAAGAATSTAGAGSTRPQGARAGADAGSGGAGGLGGLGGGAGAAGATGAGAASALGGAAPGLDAGAGDSGNPSEGGAAGRAPQAGMSARDAGAEAVDAAGPALPQPCTAGASYGDPLPDGRTAEPLRTGFNFLEGPVWHAGLSVLFFSDLDFAQSGPDGIASRIHRYTPPDTFEVFVAEAGSNGLALGRDGRLLAATHDAQTLSSFDPLTAERETHPLSYQGAAFNSPNDLTLRSDGTIYFTDPDWQLAPRESETNITGVYRVAPGGEVSLVDGALDNPNGIALSPDEGTLYVGSAGSDILAYPVASDGTTGDGERFASPGPSDGLAIDCAGNLYVTADSQVVVFSAAGDELGRITVAEAPANVAFGGADHRTLFITARTGLYTITLNVPGYPY